MKIDFHKTDDNGHALNQIAFLLHVEPKVAGVKIEPIDQPARRHDFERFT